MNAHEKAIIENLRTLTNGVDNCVTHHGACDCINRIVVNVIDRLLTLEGYYRHSLAEIVIKSDDDVRADNSFRRPQSEEGGGEGMSFIAVLELYPLGFEKTVEVNGVYNGGPRAVPPPSIEVMFPFP